MNVCGVTFGGYLTKILSFKTGNLLNNSKFHLLSEGTVHFELKIQLTNMSLWFLELTCQKMVSDGRHPFSRLDTTRNKVTRLNKVLRIPIFSLFPSRMLDMNCLYTQS